MQCKYLQVFPVMKSVKPLHSYISHAFNRLKETTYAAIYGMKRSTHQISKNTSPNVVDGVVVPGVIDGEVPVVVLLLPLL